MFRLVSGLLLLYLMTGCQALQAVDTGATLQAENIVYETEVAQLVVTGTAERIAAQQTHSISQTQIAVMNGVNQQLIATLIVQITPTPGLVVETRPDDYGLTVDRTGSGRASSASSPNTTTGASANNPYRVTGVSTRVRSSDGCVESPQTTFASTVSEVYATFVAYNLTGGTTLRAEWYMGETLMDTGDWTPDENYDEVCVWFFIDQTTFPFTPGNWSVRLFANDTPIGAAQAFMFE
jgi:hypothetical protein